VGKCQGKNHLTFKCHFCHHPTAGENFRDERVTAAQPNNEIRLVKNVSLSKNPLIIHMLITVTIENTNLTKGDMLGIVAGVRERGVWSGNDSFAAKKNEWRLEEEMDNGSLVPGEEISEDPRRIESMGVGTDLSLCRSTESDQLA
jgi:hypothetical protein